MSRACVASLFIGLSSLTLVGCATVKPESDYHRAGQIIAERTGSPDVYNPTTEELAAERIDELLEDGLTVDEAVQVALLNNCEFQSLFLEIGVSRADVVQSGLFTNPSLTLGVRFPEAGGRSELTLGLVQNLVELWQIPIRKRIAESELEETVLRIARRGVTLVAEVKTGCYEFLSLQRELQSARESRQLAADSYDLVSKQQEAGEVSAFDVGLARSNLVDVDLEILGIERDLEFAQAELTRLLGLSMGRRVWSLADQLPRPSGEEFDSNQLACFALEARLDAKVAEMEMQAAEDELIRQHLSVFPDVALGVNFERGEKRALPGRNILADTARASIAAGQLTAPSIQSRGQRDLARRQIIDTMLGPSLTITLPIWDQNQAQIAKARIRVLQRQKAYSGLCDLVVSDVLKAATAAENARLRARFFEEQALPQARENVEGATKIYESGEQSIFLLIEMQEALFERRRAYISALRDYAVAVTELQTAVGGQLPTTSVTVPDSVEQDSQPKESGDQ